MDTDSLTAVLFSGGRGSRLFPLNEYYQKVMMPLGKKGVPLLEFVIRHFRYYGIRKFLLLIGYRGNQIRRYFKDGSRFGVEIEYSFDNPNLKGTGGALLNAKDMLQTDDFIVYYTDILTSLNFSKFIQYHRVGNKKATVWLDPDWNENLNSVSYDSQNNALALNQNTDKILVNTGISAIRRDVLDLMEELRGDRKELDLSGDVFHRLAKEGELQGYISPEWWRDIGSVQRLRTIDRSLLIRRMGHLEKEGVI